MDLVIMKNQQATTTSLQVAETFEKNHRDVLKAIDDLKEGVAQNYADLFYEDEYIHPQNKQTYRQVIMNRDGFTLLAMGFTGSKALQFKLKYIEAFNQMETHIKEQQLYLPQSPMEVLKLVFDAQTETNERVDTLEIDMKEVKENQPLQPGEYSYIQKRVSQRVHEIAKGFGKITQEVLRELFKDINGGIKKVTGVSTRTQLKARHFQTVIDFIQDWEPSTATKMIVRQTALELEA